MQQNVSSSMECFKNSSNSPAADEAKADGRDVQDSLGDDEPDVEQKI